MNEPSRERESLLNQIWSRLFGRSLPLESETTRFVLVSALDVFMTVLLLRYRGGEIRFVESNPVARFFLDHWGPKGMVYFKFSMVAFVTVLAQVIALRKPELARLLLNGATLVVVAVVIYGVTLLVRMTIL